MRAPGAAIALLTELALAVGVTTVVITAAPVRAYGGDYWVWDDNDGTTPPISRFRFAPKLSFWAGTFDRTANACSPDALSFVMAGFPPGPAIQAELRTSQFGFEDGAPCYTDESDEIGFGAGIEVIFRVLGPIHLTASAQIVYTLPNRDYELLNQILVPIHFGALLTWPEWTFRPIVAAEISPLLYITDDSRDFALGGEAGIAYRIPTLGDLVATVGHHRAESLIGWEIQLGIIPD